MMHKFFREWAWTQTALKSLSRCVWGLAFKTLYCMESTGLHQVCPPRFGKSDYHPSYRCMSELWDRQPSHRQVSQYHTCMEGYKMLVERCRRRMKPICGNSTLRAVKTVRLNMETTLALMDRLPDLKVIQLMRDPRAVVLSRMNESSYFSLSSSNDSKSEARLYCMAALHDVIVRRQIEARRPGSTMQVIYEDFVASPTETATDIYKLLGLGLPKALKIWLENNLENLKVKSNAIANRWRYKLPEKTKRDTYEVCQDLIREVNSPKWA